jgi:hypothetical protein
MYGTKFKANTAEFRGAIHISGNCTVEIYTSEFDSNVAIGTDTGYGGGAIYLVGSALQVFDTVFKGNTAIRGGGAVWVTSPNTGGGGASNATFTGCSFIGNNGTKGVNDITRMDDTSNVTFACADGFDGASVTMKAGESEMTNPPPASLKCVAPLYLCNTGKHVCVKASSGTTFASCNSSCSCVVPLNCGMHNDTTVCSHSFQGCNVCPTCCKGYIKNDKDCSACTVNECKNGHTDCCK